MSTLTLILLCVAVFFIFCGIRLAQFSSKCSREEEEILRKKYDEENITN